MSKSNLFEFLRARLQDDEFGLEALAELEQQFDDLLYTADEVTKSNVYVQKELVVA